MGRSRKYLSLFAALLAAAFMASCGSASAPPVDLPAPVTGQIDVSGPSAAGKVTITGSAGAVTGGATVLATNENNVASSLWQVTDFLFPKAYAQTLPSVCDLVGRVCVVAEADGSFTMEIDAEVGDSIIIVLIDENGTEISDRITKAVPTGSGVAACGSGFEGSLVAIANSGGVVYALREGNTDAANKIFIGSQEFEVPGCYAKDIAVFEESGGTIVIAVVSSSDNKLWIGKWDGSKIVVGLTYTLDIAPHKVAFAGDSSYVIVGGVGNSVHLERILVADGSTLNSLELPNTNQNSVVALNILGPFADGGFLGMVVGSDGTLYYLTFFNAGTLANATSGGKINLTMNTWASLVYDPQVADAILGVDPQSGNQIRFLFTDSVSPAPALRWSAIGSAGLQISLNDNVADFTALIVNPVINWTDALADTYPQRFVGHTQVSIPIVYILKDDGYLWRIENVFGGQTSTLIDLSSVLPNPIAIAIDETGTSLTGGNAAGTTTDLSTYIP